MKTLTPLTNSLVTTSEEFQEYVPANFSYLLERSSSLIRRILQDIGQWSDNIAHEKLLLRLSFDLVERFLEYCPTQLPCRPSLLLDGFISEFFGKPQVTKGSMTCNPLLYRFLDGLLNRAVLSRDALICLFYHLYGMKPVEVGYLLRLEERQTQRIYKNFARWRQKGWYQTVEEAGLTDTDLHKLAEYQLDQPEQFSREVREILETLMTFYRKSDPPFYPCLEDYKWQEMLREGYGFDYRMWHFPLCLTCMESIVKFGNSFLLHTDVNLNLHLSPHSLYEEETLWHYRKSRKSAAEKSDRSAFGVFQPA